MTFYGIFGHLSPFGIFWHFSASKLAWWSFQNLTTLRIMTAVLSKARGQVSNPVRKNQQWTVKRCYVSKPSLRSWKRGYKKTALKMHWHHSPKTSLNNNATTWGKMIYCTSVWPFLKHWFLKALTFSGALFSLRPWWPLLLLANVTMIWQIPSCFAKRMSFVVVEDLSLTALSVKHQPRVSLILVHVQQSNSFFVIESFCKEKTSTVGTRNKAIQ